MSKIKICGLKRDCDIDFVNEALPDYVGFVFAKSKRQVSAKTASKLRQRLCKNIIPVGVFVNAAIEEVLAICEAGTISLIQLHGAEDLNYIERLRERTCLPLIKAIKIEKDLDISSQLSLPVDYFLFDNGAGGTGKTFDWSLMPDVEKPFFLAGGLNLANIDAAIEYSPFALDVSSGAETDGKKDRNKILELVSRVRQA